MQRIAVWNTAFLGDAVLALPLLQSLRLRYPAAIIDYYVRGGLAPLFEAHPALTNVFSYDKRATDKGVLSLFRLGREVASRNYSLWLSPHASLRSASMALASRAPVRIGYSEPLFNKFAYTRTVDRGFGQGHEVERILRLLEPLGPGPLSSWPEIVLPQAAHDRAQAFFDTLPPGPVIGLHPGSVWASKRWPVGRFAALAAHAVEHGVRTLIFAGKGEEEALAKAVVKGVSELRCRNDEPLLHDLSARTSLVELAAFISRLDCYVGNDSGPMHMAWCLRAPVVTIFGPTAREFGFIPLGEKDLIIDVDEPCRPCGRHGHTQCPEGHHRCMLRVTPEAVWSAVRDILGV